MSEFCVSLGVARRDRELARQILMAHHHMIEPLEGRRRRRRPSMVQRQYFHDALVFLGVTVRARDSEESELQFWLQLASAHRQRQTAEPSPGRKKRRRRGRSRKRGEKRDKGEPAKGAAAQPGAKPSTPAAHG